MAKFAAYIPYHQKYDKHTNEGKIPLRRLLEKSGHDDLLVKEKKGYAPDLVRLWNNYGRRICERYLLSSSNVVKYKIINPTWLSNAFELADNNDMRYVSKLLSVLSLEIWCQMYISHAINPNLRL